MAVAPLLRDQRQMVGRTPHRTCDDVEAAWQAWTDRQGLPIRRRAGDLTTDLRESGAVLVGYVSAGSWTADCVCGGGVPGWPRTDESDGNPRGCCLDCGTIYELEYPPPDEIAAATDALMARPQVYRTWRPDRGETVDDLATENEQHGFSRTASAGASSAEIARHVEERFGADGRRFLESLGEEPKS